MLQIGQEIGRLILVMHDKYVRVLGVRHGGRDHGILAAY